MGLGILRTARVCELWIVVLLACSSALAGGCGGDDSGGCPESLPVGSAEWSAADVRAECVELASALNSSGVGLSGLAGEDDAGEDDCGGSTSQSDVGGQCRATIEGSCAESGLSFAIDCKVRSDRGADCDVTIDAPELERVCKLKAALR